MFNRHNQAAYLARARSGTRPYFQIFIKVFCNCSNKTVGVRYVDGVHRCTCNKCNRILATGTAHYGHIITDEDLERLGLAAMDVKRKKPIKTNGDDAKKLDPAAGKLRAKVDGAKQVNE